MPFNASTYRSNRARRAAWSYLHKARALKKRVAEGMTYDWERLRIAHYVRLARLSMREHLALRRIG